MPKTEYALALLILFLTAFLFLPRVDKHSIYIERVVLPGETLWSIATEIDPVQTGKLVFEIEKTNKCTSDIKPGDVLKVPMGVK